MAYKIDLEKKLLNKAKTIKEARIIPPISVEQNVSTKEDEEQLLIIKKMVIPEINNKHSIEKLLRSC